MQNVFSFKRYLPKAIVQSVHTFNKYLLRICYLSGTVLASECTEMTMANKTSVPVENRLLTHSTNCYLLINMQSPQLVSFAQFWLFKPQLHPTT